ncbi:MAG: nuclear transport factor 2 family protein [Proteobacteria bacterium]|nr:nuclear transport factor 2 family protein [Pseudomonadota bacterium]
MQNQPSTEALSGLRAYREAERAAYNSSDLEMVSNFAEDIILTTNGAPTLRGRLAVRAFFECLWVTTKARFVEVVDEEIAESGDHLFVAGRFVLELTPRSGGTPVLEKGRFQGVLVRGDDGRYVLWREACMDAGPE